MLLGYNGFTAKDTTLEQDVIWCSELGFETLELRDYKLDDYLENHSIEDLKQLLKEYNMPVVSLNSLEVNAKAFEDPSELYAKLEKLAKYSVEIDCPYIVAAPMFNVNNLSKKELMDGLKKLYNEMAKRAKAIGNVKVGLEFIGLENRMLANMSEAVELKKYLENDDVGLVVDTFAFHATGSKIQDIMELEGKDVFVVHFNDCRKNDGPFTENDREYPGEGVMAMKDIYNAFTEIGFDGAYTVELICEDVWEHDPKSVVTKSFETIANVLK